MKKVDVPEPAKTLFEKTHGLLDKYLPKALPKGKQWAVGGGTMLAARWRHRLSNDLDILLHEDSNLRKLDGDRGRAMQADFRATGAIEFDWDSDVCRTILYGTSKIDIIVGRATPAEGKETAEEYLAHRPNQPGCEDAADDLHGEDAADAPTNPEAMEIEQESEAPGTLMRASRLHLEGIPQRQRRRHRSRASCA